MMLTRRRRRRTMHGLDSAKRASPKGRKDIRIEHMHVRTILLSLSIGAVLTFAPAAMAQDAGDTDDAGSLTEKETPAGGDADQPDTGQKDKAGNDKPPAGDDRGRGPGSWLLPVMIGGFLLLYIWMSRGKKKEQARRKEMLESLKKGDKVTTIGGVVGTVMNVKDDEVTVKVDETTNTRMTFARWAVRGIGDAAKAESPREAEKKP